MRISNKQLMMYQEIASIALSFKQQLSIINDTQNSALSALIVSLYIESFGPKCNDLARKMMQLIQVM
jgi:hypothetical protein